MRVMWMMRLVRISFAICTAVALGRDLPAHAADAQTTNQIKKLEAEVKDAKAEAKDAKATAAELDEKLKKAIEAAKKYPNDVENYLGDTIRLNRDTKAVAVDPMTNATTEVCIPAGTYLKGGSQIDPLTKEWAFIPACDYPETFKLWACDASFETCEKPGLPVTKVKAGTMLKLRVDDFENVRPNRYGVTFGGLVVPFKFQLSGKQEFKASATAAPYMGYRLGFEGYGVELAPVVFAGIGVVSAKKKKETTTTTTGDQTKTKTETETTELASFSYGIGLIGTLKRSFHFGAMLGFDHTGTGKGYEYNDNPWFALELGASFN